MSQVSDYDIANASGAAVRADINLVLDAIKTLNSGSGDPSNAVAFMLYGDTSDNILKVRNSANSSFTEIGNINQANLGLLPKDGTTAMTGGLSLILGAANNLSLKFSGDTDTGLFRQSSNSLGIVAGGTERVRVDTNGLNIRGGHSIQIYNSNNGNRIDFDFAGSSNIDFALPTADGSNGSVLQTNGSGQLSFVAIQGVPTGTIFCFAIATVPAGYLECNGQSTSGHAALAALIGSNVPDLRGEFVRGWANTRAVDQNRQIGSTQGEENKSHNHSISLSGTTSNKSLTGNVRKISETFGGVGTTSGIFSKMANQDAPLTPGGPDTSPTGGFEINASHDHTFSASGTSGSQGSENRPRNVALMYICLLYTSPSPRDRG